METREKKVNGQTKEASVILYGFYINSMASKAVVNARSALPWGTRKTVNTASPESTILNCTRLLPWENVPFPCYGKSL
jgi:hypothetical protein